MSFLAKLKIDGQEYNILDCSYAFEQTTDKNNKPSGAPRGGKIRLAIESRGTTDFFQWMIEHRQAKDGVITFYRRDAMSRLYELKFSDCFCINYREQFSAFSPNPLQIIMTLSAKEINIEGVQFKNTWVV